MKHFIDLEDISNIQNILNEALHLKKHPLSFKKLGKHKTLGMLFFNSSLRTRMSTQKAAQNLGMHCIVINFTSDAWQIEFEDGGIMDGTTSEHIKEAAAVVSQYCDIIAVRAFPTLTDKQKDESEYVLNSFKKYALVPIVNMESATAHPLQALADALTITELQKTKKPKIVLSWAPHPKPLPHAVANSFIKMMHLLGADFTITHPKGYELNPNIVRNTQILYNQEEALKNADFVYVKNWSNYLNYGKITCTDSSWTLTQQKMQLTNNGKFMHCLPIRRNVVATDGVLDNSASIVNQQASNRTYAAQAVLKNILEHDK